MRRLKIQGNCGQDQVSPSPPGPLLLWLGIKKAHKGEWALSAAQPAASVLGGAGGQMRTKNLQCQKRFKRHWEWKTLSNQTDFNTCSMLMPCSIRTTETWGRSRLELPTCISCLLGGWDELLLHELRQLYSHPLCIVSRWSRVTIVTLCQKGRVKIFFAKEISSSE